MTKYQFIVSIVCALALMITIVSSTLIVSRNSTERLQACVENGGAYVRVAETSSMECQQ